MSTPNSDPPRLPGRALDTTTVPAGSTDETVVGPAPLVVSPPPYSPPPPLPPAGDSPPPPGPTPPNASSGGNYSLPMLIGVFVLALVGIGLLGLGIYAVVKLNSNTLVAAGIATGVPLSTQVVLVPTTTIMPTAAKTPTAAPTATHLPATPTSAATAAAAATTPITATASLTPTQASNLLTIAQGANVRTGPGVNYPVVGGLKVGDTAPVVGRDASSSWYEISYKGGFAGQGWISAVTATYNGDKNQLPVVAAPPPPAPTATPKPAGNPNGGLVNGAHGVSGMLNLCSSQVTFAVNERVCFVEWIKNNTTQSVAYGILGVTAIKAGGGTQFQTSWSGQDAAHGLLAIDPGCIGPTDRCKGQWEDGMRLSSPGNYQLFLNVCFSDYPTCRGSSGDWEVLSGSIVITIQ
jgi:uncharacterized protein YraI